MVMVTVMVGSSILRARGGSSALGDGIKWVWEYSPRTRR